MSAAVEGIVSNVLRAGTMVGGPTMAPVAKPGAKPPTTSTPTQASQPVVQRLFTASQPASADTHHGTLLLGVGIAVVLTFAVFTLGRSS